MKERIERILKDKKLSQAEFADRIGVNRSSITHLMTGRNKSSETVLARTLLEFPDINPIWLSEGEGDVYKSVVISPNIRVDDTSIEEDNALEDENFLTPYTPYPLEEKAQITKIQQPRPPSGSHISASVNEPASYPQQDVGKEKIQEEEKKHETKAPDKSEKQIRKIVFFYDDKTFEEYYPEKT